jgi:hypothetical protein
MKQIFLIEHSVFDSQTLVAIGVTDKKLLKWIELNTNLIVDDEFKHHIKVSGEAKAVINGKFSMIRFNGWSGSNKDISLLSHEAFHLAEFIFDRIGVKYDIDISGEVFAYFIQSTVKQILDGLEEKKDERS